ncbi:Gfo/Idh/MocA family oxidoreductase [Jiangella endophytica]|uniref:Gfo/Idh/MocA family oxidoreductase n=1 Tax=Jiangella endophytica TaxID=1623398 RepID=UPI0013002BFC|nr:Gfo/Idh/MocA family oxidoreductase [Jiangella endophytica]
MRTAFHVVGTGWRAEFFLRIAQALPERFEVRAVLARSASRAAGLTTTFGVPVVDDPCELRGFGTVDFAVVSVPASSAPALTTSFVGSGIPVLTETPPAPDLPGLLALYDELGATAPVRVAEQYRHQPHHAARLALAGSGLIGPVTYTRISVAHGYHAMSLVRLALGTEMAAPVVRAVRFADPAVRPHDRDGWRDELTVEPGTNTIATLDFGDRTAVYEFSGEQYLSPIRGRHLAIRGERGEIVDDQLSYVRGPRDVVRSTIRRDDTGRDGDLAGLCLRELTCDGRRVWQNPFGTARLSDDELAGAAILAEMADFVRTGRGGYGLVDAAQDQYLSLLVDEAARSGTPLAGTSQPWAHT